MHDAHMNIARFRKSRNLSQRDLAEMVGCDQSTIHRAETMHSSAKMATYLDYASALDMELWELFSEDVTPEDLELLRIFRAVPKSKHDQLLALVRLAKEDPREEGE